MKKLFFTIVIVLSSIFVNAQSDIFVLIDISGNPLNSTNKITSSERIQAIELCKQLIEGRVSNSQFSNWEAKNLDNFIAQSYNGKGNILNQINSITVVPYGNKNTYKKFKIFQNNSPKVNLEQSIKYANSFTYTDQLTFGELARAKAADIAIDANIKSYYLIEISGLGGDQTGSQGLSSKQQRLIDEYKSSAVIAPIGLFILEGKPLRLTAKVININTMTGNKNTSGSKGIITSNNVNRKSLKIISPIGTKSDYDEVKEKDGLSISWLCLGCDKNTEYIVTAKNTKTNKTKKTTVIGRNNTLMQLDPGLYKISIKGKGLSSCQNNNQYVEIKGKANTGGWFFFLFVILIAGAAYYVKKNDPFGWWDEDKKKKKTNNNDDEFDSLY
jgi:hypothetical protein